MSIKSSLRIGDILNLDEFTNAIYNHPNVEDNLKTPLLKDKLILIYSQRCNKNFITIDTAWLTPEVYKFQLTEGFKHIGYYKISGDISGDKIKQHLALLIFKLGTL